MKCCFISLSASFFVVSQWSWFFIKFDFEHKHILPFTSGPHHSTQTVLADVSLQQDTWACPRRLTNTRRACFSPVEYHRTVVMQIKEQKIWNRICKCFTHDMIFSSNVVVVTADSADRESSLDLIKLDISRTFPPLFIFQKVLFALFLSLF